MDAKELARILNGRQYMNEITEEEKADAESSGLVVVFGYNDDGMEFRGAIFGEVCCFGGGTAYITSSGILENDCCEIDCPYILEKKKGAMTVEAVWDRDGYAWIYDTDIPHETFDIMIGDEKYCRGIVFSLRDLK